MKQFAFQLAPLLQLRRNQRDLLRRELADLSQRRDALSERRDCVESERTAQLDELRGMAADSELDVEASLSRHAFASRLSEEISRIHIEKERVEGQLDVCRAALLRADQRVEALEKLAERRRLEFVAQQDHRERLQHEDSWQSRLAMQHASA